MSRKIEKGHLGPTFDRFLEEQRITAETKKIAAERAIAWQAGQTVAEEKITKVEMARSQAPCRKPLR